MSFLNRNAATPLFAATQNTTSTENVIQENKNMNTPNPVITSQEIFDERRAWAMKNGLARLNYTVEQISAMHPDEEYLALFASREVRLTGATQDTRKAKIAVVFRNRVQDHSMGQMLALKKHVNYAAAYTDYQPGYRAIALLDMDGDHDIVVIEEVNAHSGQIEYNAYYGTKAYNNHGQPIGLNQGSKIKTGEQIQARVIGYNTWVDQHDADVKAAAKVWPNVVATKAMARFEIGTCAENFVQINCVTYHIKYETIINKYALLAMTLVAAKNEDGIKFEVFSRAKTAETTEKFLNTAMTNMTYGYQSQLKALSGIEFVPQA